MVRDLSPRVAVAALLLAVVALGLWPYHEILGWLPWGADAAKWVQHGSLDDPGWWRWASASKHFVGYRPVTALSFLANNLVTGYAALGYRATDLGLHLATGGLLFTVHRRLTGDRSAWGLVAVAILFLHPATEEVVPHVARRSYLLATAFGLGALLTWLACLDAAALRAKVGWALATAALIGLGVLSNELAYVFVGVLPWIAALRPSAPPPPPAEPLARRLAIAAACLSPTAIVVALAIWRRYAVLGTLGGYAKRYFAFVHNGIPMWRELPSWQPKRIAESCWHYVFVPTGVSGADPLFGGELYTVAPALLTAWLVWVGVAYPAVRWREPELRIRWALVAWAVGAGAITVLSQTWFWRQAYPLLPPIGMLTALGVKDALTGLEANRWRHLPGLGAGAALTLAAAWNGPLPTLDPTAHDTTIHGTPVVGKVQRLVSTIPSPAVVWLVIPLRSSGAHIARIWSERLAPAPTRFRLLGHLAVNAVDDRADVVLDRDAERPTIALRNGFVLASGAVSPGSVDAGAGFAIDQLWQPGPPAWVVAVDGDDAWAVRVPRPPAGVAPVVVAEPADPEDEDPDAPNDGGDDGGDPP